MHRRNLLLLCSLLFAFEAGSSYVYTGLAAAFYFAGSLCTYRSFKSLDMLQTQILSLNDNNQKNPAHE